MTQLQTAEQFMDILVVRMHQQDWALQIRMVLATGEVVVGVIGAAESGGVSLYLVVDGVARIGTNLTDFHTTWRGRNKFRRFNWQTSEWRDRAKCGGEYINDALTAGLGAGMVGDFYDAGAALSAGKFGAAAYSGLSGGAAAVDIYNILNSLH